jgi:hypothetical protein
MLLRKRPPLSGIGELATQVLAGKDGAERVVKDTVHFVGVRHESVDDRRVGDERDDGCRVRTVVFQTCCTDSRVTTMWFFMCAPSGSTVSTGSSTAMV